MISLIIPAKNEVDNIPILVKEISSSLGELSYELIFVNDGSTDTTGEVLDSLARKDKKIKVINFRKNYGQTAAISAGIDIAKGNTVVFLDADLQNDPKDIPHMLRLLDQKKVDVVAGWRKKRQDKFFSRILPSIVANWIIGRVTGVRLHDYGCTLKVFRRDSLAPIKLYGEMHRFLPAYAAMSGAKITEIPVNHRPRRFGKTKYGLIRTGKVLLDLLTVQFLDHFLTKPIYIFGLVSFFCFGGAFLCLIYLIWIKLHGISFIQSPALLLGTLFSILGLMFLALGLLAELIIRIYYESQDKKPYLIRSTRNIKR